MKYEFRQQDAWDLAQYLGIQVKQRGGDELQFLECPYCRGGKNRRDKGSFSINLSTGQCKCLRASCGVQGNMLTLSRDFGFSLGEEFEEAYRPQRSFRSLPTPAAPIKPKPAAIAYLERRGIHENTAKRYEITVQNEHENILVFPFYDDKGVMQFVKYRKTDFDKTKDKNKEWCERNTRPILFGMKQCMDFTRLVITEGQLDSLSVAESGIENAVSVPTGAKGFTWVPYCWEWVKQFEKIVVFGDFEKGSMSLLAELNQRFPNVIYRVREEDYRGCKDANEILQKYGPAAVKKAVERAEQLPVKRVKQLSSVEKVDIYKLPKLKTGVSKLDRILGGGLFFGQVDIIGGKRGDGKSTFASQILVQAREQGYKCFAYSGELPDYLFKSWMDFQAAGPDCIVENYWEDGSVNRFVTNSNSDLLNAWYQDKCFLYDTSIVDDDEQEDLIQTIRDAIMQYGVQVILVDNLMTAIDLDAQAGTEKYDRQSIFVKKLARIAMQFQVLILLVAHRRKGSFSGDANDEISGSADITNLAGVVMSYDRDKELPANQRRLVVSKSRLIGKLCLDGFVMNYDEKSRRIYGEGDDLYQEFGWKSTDDFVSVENSPFDMEMVDFT